LLHHWKGGRDKQGLTMKINILSPQEQKLENAASESLRIHLETCPVCIKDEGHACEKREVLENLAKAARPVMAQLAAVQNGTKN